MPKGKQWSVLSKGNSQEQPQPKRKQNSALPSPVVLLSEGNGRNKKRKFTVKRSHPRVTDLKCAHQTGKVI